MMPKFERNRIYCMDALEMLEQLPDASADLVLTDPPYGISYQNHFTKARHPEIIGDRGFDYESMAVNCYRILKDNTHAYFFTRFDRYPYHYQMLMKAGFTVKNCLVIQKSNVGGIGDLHGSFANNSEWIIFCQKGRRFFSATELLKNQKAGNRPAAYRSRIAEYKTRFPACWFGEEYPKATRNSTWRKKAGIIHPSAKNVVCLEWLILLSSSPGELVVDPFMGSGSTALAAIRTNRSYLGCEICRDYYQLSLDRIEKEVST